MGSDVHELSHDVGCLKSQLMNKEMTVDVKASSFCSLL